MRTLFAWLLGLVGVIAAGYGVFRPWYEGRTGVEVPVADLFVGVRRDSASLLTSMAVPVLLGLALVVVGLLVSTLLLRLGSLLVALSAVVWVVRSNAAVGMTELQLGVWNVVFGSALVLVAAMLKGSKG